MDLTIENITTYFKWIHQPHKYLGIEFLNILNGYITLDKDKK